MKAVNKLSVVFTALLLAGCTSFAPDYQRPVMPVPQGWPVQTDDTQAQPEAAGQQVVLPDWEGFVVDPALRELIRMALENNRDLRVAALNIEKARAQYRISRSEAFPAIGASGAGDRQRQPAELSPTGLAGVSGQYQAAVGANSYELDFFGRIRSLNDEALARFLSTEQARRAVQTALIADVAFAYLQLAADQERLALARRTLETQRSSYDLIARSQQLGAATLLDVRQAQTQVESARVDVARYSSQVLQGRNALDLLLGTSAPSRLLPAEQADDKTTLTRLGAGVSSQILLQRPDVLEAEYVLQAANANIGAARAAFFPRISLTASAGTASNDLSNLFAAGSGFWQFIPRIELPIFDAGRNSAALRVSEVQRDIALAQYEKSIQTAFREVADVLASRSTLTEQLQAQSDLVQALDQYYQLSQARFNSGADSYLAVLDAQRSLYAAQQDLITLRFTGNTSTIQLYKALGGGWPAPA